MFTACGSSGGSEKRIQLFKFHSHWNIICINNESIDLVRGSFVVFPEKIEVLKVSGTLKGLGAKKLKNP